MEESLKSEGFGQDSEIEKSLNIEKLRETFNCQNVDIRTYSPLVLAYIGDAAYELIIRYVLLSRGNIPVNALNKDKVKFVNAKTQAALIDVFMDKLTEDEQSVYRRGKNAKSTSKAKNATYLEYSKATGFEALMGYLFLQGNGDRMIELIKLGMDELGMEI